MRKLTKIAIGIFITPFVLIMLYIGFEIVGMAVNHCTTERQTKRLTAYIEENVADAEIRDARSFTGNTGNGNHVDCVSEVEFTSEIGHDELDRALEGFLKDSTLRISEKDGVYTVGMTVPAPFPDNIEGH